ncbi:MAG TPA: hypothetical protein VMW38_06085 [Terriglobia bacterium]|nr:hypothetical protein [Terriglobia bacterium]
MSTIQMPNIEFGLTIMSARDDQTGAWIGYIPLLRLYSQASEEKHLKDVMCQTAMSFIGICWHRKILDKVLRERGMRKRDGETLERRKKARGQYIIVGGQAGHDTYQDVPIELLAGKQTLIECQR